MDLNVILISVFFGKTEMKYFGFWVICYVVRPVNKRLEAITNMMSSITNKGVHKLIGIVNYHQNRWGGRSNTLHPLS